MKKPLTQLLWISLSFICCVAMTEEEFKEGKEQCMNKTGISEIQASAIFRIRLNYSHKPLGCYINCLLKHFEVIDSKGKIQSETFEALFPPILMYKVNPKICEATGQKDPCKHAIGIVNCFDNKYPLLLHYFTSKVYRNKGKVSH